MVVTVNISEADLALIKQATDTQSDAEAVTLATKEILRLTQLKQLKSASGKVDFNLNWEALEAAELGELPN